MNSLQNRATKSMAGIVLIFVLFLLAGCQEYKVPITKRPTRKIDPRLLGVWNTKDQSEDSGIQIIKYDDYNYLVAIKEQEKSLLYRVYHSDLQKTSFVTAQFLESPDPLYAYMKYTLSEDGVLHVWSVNKEVIPEKTTSSATIRRLLKKNLHNPALLVDEALLIKVDADKP